MSSPFLLLFCRLSLDVIYGDTDSIMINTAVPSRDEFDSPALLLGDKEERESPAAQKVRPVWFLLFGCGGRYDGHGHACVRVCTASTSPHLLLHYQ